MKKRGKKRICTKSKGTKAERELFHMFWDIGWGCARIAGSGSTQRPATDLLASNGNKVLALECKAIKGKVKYFSEEELEQLYRFANSFGAEPMLALRFDNNGWFFLHLDDVNEKKGKHYPVSMEIVKNKGKRFDKMVGMFK